MSSLPLAAATSTYAEEIRTLLAEVRRRWTFIVFGIAAGAAVGAAIALLPAPYEAVAVLAVRPASAQGAAASIALMEYLLQNRETAQRALQETGATGLTADQYLDKYQRSENPPGTFVIRLRVRGEDPNMLANMANAVSRIAVERAASVFDVRPRILRRRQELVDELARARKEMSDTDPRTVRPPAGGAGSADALANRVAYEQAARTVQELSSRLSAFDAQTDLTSADFVLIDPAVPPATRVRRNLPAAVSGGAATGACLGLLAAGLLGLWRAVGAGAP